MLIKNNNIDAKKQALEKDFINKKLRGSEPCFDLNYIFMKDKKPSKNNNTIKPSTTKSNLNSKLN